MSVRLRLIASSLSALLLLLTLGAALSFVLFYFVANPFLAERLHENLGMIAARYFPAAGFLVLILAGAGALWMLGVSAKHVVRPLQRLKRAAVEIRDGNLSHELAVSGQDEFAELSACFEQMRIRLKDSTRAARVAEADRNAMMASICHDLKTPITSIMGYAEGILDGVADSPEKLFQYATVIRKKAAALQNLADDLSLLSRLEDAQLPMDMVPADFGAFVRELASDFAAETPGMELSVHISTEFTVRFDRDKMARVLHNLLQNSVKYKKPDQALTLRLSLAALDGNALLTVADNGMGITPADMPHVFERFYRADASRGQKPGSGLGLSITRQIVQLHGGSIWMAPGKDGGVTASISLPGVPQEAAGAADAQAL